MQKHHLTSLVAVLMFVLIPPIGKPFIAVTEREARPSAVPNVFRDVSQNHWAVAWINQLYSEGITGGCNTNPLQFCPEQDVTRAQMAVFILRAIHGASYTTPASTDIFSDV